MASPVGASHNNGHQSRSHSRSRSGGQSPTSRRSRPSSASGSMGLDGGEAGRMVAAEEEYIRRELQDTNNFCNAFWGTGDAGYEIIQARMKTANRTMDEVRALYKERAEIEADYAKRLAKLAKQPVGREETGATKAALDVVRAELDMTARVHSDLSVMTRKDLEGSLADFQSKATSARKNSAASIEKLYKNKQAQANYVNKSREKYEQDCIKINGYTAQSSLVQGRDLDKVTNKLDKAQSTVATNDKDYQNFVRALKDTTLRWNSEWKAYLDQCQDLEEDRLEFIKSNLWNYANALSAVCVADDEGCERVRVALENCETGGDIADFIQHRGTGPAIPDPPEYINYAKGQPPPARPSFRSANFQRTSTRTTPLPTASTQTFVPPAPPSQPSQPPQSQSPTKDHRGDGHQPPPPAAPPSGGLQESVAPLRTGPSPGAQPSQQRGNTSPYKPPPGAVGLPGMATNSSAQEDVTPQASVINGQRNDAQNQHKPSALEKTDKRISAKDFLTRTPSKRGDATASGSNRMSQQGSQVSVAPATSAAPDEDPMTKALANLRARPGGRSPAPTSQPQMAPAANSNSQPQVGQVKSSHRLSQAPPRSPSPSVGSTMHRPSSPSAAFMQEPQAPSSPLPVEEVLGSYGQSFPGERRRSVSRQNSVSSAISSRSNAQGGSRRESNVPPGANPDGFAGVGARGRSPSPQPFGRPASRQQQSRPPVSNSAQQHSGRPHHHQAGQSSISTPAQQPPQRSTTPLGISLDASGSVTHDQMAQDYMRRAGSVPPPQQQQAQQPPVTQNQQQYQHLQQQRPPQQHQQSYQHQQHQQHPQRPSSVVHGGHQQHPTGSTVSGYQTAPSQMSSAGSNFTITPGQYGGHPGAQPQHQQASQSQQGYYAGHQQQASTPGGYGQSGPQFSHQDSSSSLGRASGYNYGQHHMQPSASQSLHGNMAQGPPAPTGTPGPMSHQYGGHHDTPASAYRDQYQTQAAPPPASTPTPGPYGAAAGQPQHHHHQQPPQQQQQHWSQPSHAQQGYSHPGAPAAVSQPPPQQQQQQQQATSPAASTTPAPTGQYSDTGKPILFYVKAMYDYSGATDEEFSFTTGDIIAVTQTDPDGWWQGELLDEARRRRGANTFPSNFTTLLT
ncbi:unnamed protein product [Sympodiomycopsis kandeliae]